MDQQLLTDIIRTFIVILGSLAVGYCLRKAGRVQPAFGTVINRVGLTWTQAPIIAVALWATTSLDVQSLVLPLYALILIIIMWPVGAVMSRGMKMNRLDRGTFITGSMFSNVGFTYGTFLTYVALGTQGAALGALYALSFMPAFYIIGFYVARRYSPNGHKSMLEALWDQLRDGQSRNPLLGIAAGIVLHFLAPPPPAGLVFSLDVAIPLTTALFLLALGLQLKLSAVRDYWREGLAAHALKFVISPIIGLTLAVPFGYWAADDRSLLQVVFIMSATPGAIMSVILADIFSLNRALAGALWLTTNITAIFFAPLVLIIARSL